MTDPADKIAEARRTGTLTDAPSLLTIEAAYALQDRVATRLGATAGWKIGATNAAGQAFLGITEPIRGHILKSGVYHHPACVPITGSRSAEAEPEILFQLQSDPYATSDPVDAIGAVHVGIEINRPSYADAFAHGIGPILADNAAHVAIVTGPQIAIARLETPAKLGVDLYRNGLAAGSGDAATVLGNPFAALRWLATHLKGTERRLRMGDWVATGGMCRACPLESGDTVVADFGILGRVSVTRPL